MMLCFFFCCLSWGILGADTDLKTVESLMDAKKPKKNQVKIFLLIISALIVFIILFVFVVSSISLDVLPLS
jgi:hypothetical protein